MDGILMRRRILGSLVVIFLLSSPTDSFILVDFRLTLRNDELTTSPLPSLNDSVRDRVLWVDNNNSGMDFTVSTAWSSLEGNHLVVPWCLPTQDRMLWKDEPPDLECSLCSTCMDSHSHLFFQSSFSREVSDSILHVVDWMNMPDSWDQIMEVISDTRRSPKRLMQKLAFVASIYYIWQERNRRLFIENRRTAVQLIKEIWSKISIRVAWKESRVEWSGVLNEG
ncbi:uncharacterized protein LOC112514133 [Cynara cardunculus var. scolymus]|uniref:uncharacterized protein LOC112514133 n=1 Tax=Cynara cardunculus var. scolymus TaxID=59895 RepID=UPI000D6291E2|nr:uncharacterized protein LOC112514133 [Cynara cardunculus var. scolymus]